MAMSGGSSSTMSGGSSSAMSGSPSRSAMSGGSWSALPGPSGSVELEFLPLIPRILTDSQKIEYLRKETKSQKKEHMKVREFTKIWCTRDLVIYVGEIWKWNVMKHLGDISDGRYLWEAGVQYFVLVREMKELFRECILARNDAAHLTTIKVLDNAVLNIKKAIAMFPDLIESHPSQCKTIAKYSHFKTFLKDNFK